MCRNDYHSLGHCRFEGVAIFTFVAALSIGLWWQLSGEWSVNDQLLGSNYLEVKIPRRV